MPCIGVRFSSGSRSGANSSPFGELAAAHTYAEAFLPCSTSPLKYKWFESNLRA